VTSFRKTALAGGLLYLITFIGSIPAALLVGPAISGPNYVLGTGPDQQVAFGLVLELVNALACFGCAVALFSVVRREHEGLAVGYLATRLFEAAAITVGVISLLAVISLRQQGAATGDAESLAPVGSALVSMRNWAMVLGPGMAGFNALMLGTALYRAHLVPRWLPALGIIGAPILIAWVIGTILGVTGPGTVFQGIAVFPFFTWELVLGLWLTFKGFNPNSRLALAERARLAQADPSTSDWTPAGVTAKAGAA
jgi:hypothetical protein